MIVDDFNDTLVLYDALLTDDGHRVRTALSGAEALARVEEREPGAGAARRVDARDGRGRSAEEPARARGGARR